MLPCLHLVAFGLVHRRSRRQTTLPFHPHPILALTLVLKVVGSEGWLG